MAENNRTPDRSAYKANRLKVFPTSGSTTGTITPTYTMPSATKVVEARVPDRVEPWSEQARYGAWIGGMSPEQRLKFKQQTGLDQQPKTNVNLDIAGALGLSGGGSGGGGGPSSSDKLAWAKWQYEKEQDALEAEKQQRAYDLMRAQLEDGSYRGNVDAALKRLAQMEATSQAGIGTTYDNALKNIAAGYDVTSGLTTGAYNSLTDYLTRNPNQAFQGLTQQVTTPQDQMQQMLGAYGVVAPEVQQQVQAELLAGQQSAGAFNTLADFLSRASQQADLSRLAEARLAGSMASTQLGQEQAAYRSQAARARQDALTALAERMAQARFDQEQNAEEQRQAIINALIAAGFDPNTPKTPVAPTKTPVDPTPPAIVPLTPQQVADFQAARLGL